MLTVHDPSHYFGQHQAAIHIEKATNGMDADVMDNDPNHYFGVPSGSQGCTPGYWKNHLDSWPPAGYSPTQAVGQHPRKEFTGSAAEVPTR